MGKASKRRREGASVAHRPDPEPASTILVAASAGIMLALSVVPLGPFHVLPMVTRIPLAAILALSMLSCIPRISRFDGPRAALTLEACGLTIILATWFLLKLVGLHPSGTDDNIYFYLANRVAQGAFPYKDFFFSHPPVHLLVPAAVFKIAGYSIGTAKLIPVLAQTIAGLFMYLTLRPVSRRLALVALFSHFSTYQILMGSTDMNGENIMTMFLWAAAWAGFRRHPVIAGALAGLAIGTGMYALAGVLALGIAILFLDRKAAIRYFAGFLGVFALMLLIFGIAGGQSFFDGVFLYHTKKVVSAEGRQSIFSSPNPFRMVVILISNLAAFLKGATFMKTLYYHGAMFLLLLPAAWLAVLAVIRGEFGTKSFRPHFIALFSIVTTILFIFQWAAVNEVYDFYLVPMLSFMCPAVGYAVDQAVSRMKLASRPSALAFPVAVLAAAWVAIPWSASLNASLWPEESRLKGQKVAYEWRDPSILKGPARLTRVLFFADSRERGAITPYFFHYIWNKSLAFDSVDEIAEFVKQNTTPDQTVTGASTLAPLVALHAGRRMSADEADTNAKRFNSGMLTDAGFMEKVCADKVAFVVSASGSYFPSGKMTSAEPFKSTFHPVKTFSEKKLKHFKDFPITLFKTREGSECGRM